MNLSIGENIRIMRRKCGFTQEELAERLSVTPQAVSKWENSNGTPDISLIVPLAQIFGITTDSLLGVVSAAFGKAHTEAALGHEKLLMETSQPAAEKHLAAYTYFRAESEKEPTNYDIMRKCINHGAEISRYVDFDGFLSDKPELRDEIFADCERKNLCISRYCECRENIEKSDQAMAWIYIHIKEFDKAKQLIDRLPSLGSNKLKESMMTQYVLFQYGFEKEKPVIEQNLSLLASATAKELFYSLEDYVWHGSDIREAVQFGDAVLAVINGYKQFKQPVHELLFWENHLRKYLPKCRAAAGDITGAANELLCIARNHAESDGYAENCTEEALGYVDEAYREQIKSQPEYAKALEIIAG